MGGKSARLARLPEGASPTRLVPLCCSAPAPVGVLTVDLVWSKVGYVITQTTPKQFNDPEILDPLEYPNGDSDGYLMWKDL